jgi:arylesterase / paraoxonase
MKIKRLLLLLFAVIFFLVIKALYVAGSFKTLNPHLQGNILQVYEGMPGPEDMDLDEATGSIFISSSDRWRLQQGLDAPTDGIYLLQPDSGLLPRKLPTTFSGDFHPHGISFLRVGDLAYLYVVNHCQSGEFVEVFTWSNDTLHHLRSISDGLMISPNDVVAVAPDQFYVTNDHGYPHGFMRTLEDYLQLPFSSLIYYNGTGFTTVARRLLYANGVNVSNNGTLLYVATTTGRTLLTYHRDTSSGLLTPAGRLNLKTGLDNIHVDAGDNLWIGAHPKMLAFVGHAKDSAKWSPSQVLYLSPKKEGGFKISEVMLDSGDRLSGSSVALPYKDSLYVGGVFQARVLQLSWDGLE